MISKILMMSVPSKQMKTLQISLFVVLVALSSASIIPGRRSKGGNEHKSNEFEYLLFSQQSTEGYCRATGKCASDKVRDYWTIHGLWPTNATSWPQDCDPSHPFVPSTIESLRDELDKFWPSVTSENSDSFWSHEWSKHGTCAKSISDLSGEFNYFHYTMVLYRYWNLTQYLNDAQIFPDNERTYEISEIQDALDKNLQAKADLECQNVRGLHAPVLTEIHFCLDKSLHVMDCPIKNQNCGEEVFYIAHV